MKKIWLLLSFVLLGSLLAFLPQLSQAIPDSPIGSFEIVQRYYDKYARQGVAYDGTYYYTASGYMTNDMIYKWDASFTLVTSRNVSADNPTTKEQINSIHYNDTKLYIGASNYPDTPKLGWVLIYNATDLTPIEYHSVKDYWSEGGAFHDGYWWNVYHDYKYASKYDASWNFVADYALTFPVTPHPDGSEGYQGAVWIDDFFYVNIHGEAGPAKLDEYWWNGASFEEVKRLDRPSIRCTQGIAVSPDEQYFIWAERDYPNGNPVLVTRIVPTSGEFQYNIYGPYLENGEVAPYLVNVSATKPNAATESFALNGTDGVVDSYQINATEALIAFFWNLTSSGNQTRSIYCTGSLYESIYIFLPDSPCYLYTVSFYDLVGVLKDYPYVAAKCLIEGVYRTVERPKVDAQNKAFMILTYNHRYTLTLGTADSEYTYGDVSFGSELFVTLTIRGIDFPKETLLTYKYVRIYGLRAFASPNGTITINYEDTLSETYNVTLTITNKTGSTVNSYSTSSQSFSYQWTSASNDSDYQVTATIDHARYGVYSWKQYFPRTFSSNPWDSLGFLGSLQIDIRYGVAIFLILIAGGMFGMINAYIGGVLASCVAAFLTYIGWIPIAPGVLITAFCLSMLLAIVYTKRRVNY